MAKLTALLLLVPTLALAQTTQPVYIRPSKGKVLSFTVPASTANFASPVLDFTAFQSVQLQISCPSLQCDGFGNTVVTTSGAVSVSGTFVPEQDPNGVAYCNWDRTGNKPCQFQLSNMSSYVKVSVNNPTNKPLVLDITPIPLNARVSVNGPTALNAGFVDDVNALAPVLVGGKQLAELGEVPGVSIPSIAMAGVRYGGVVSTPYATRPLDSGANRNIVSVPSNPAGTVVISATPGPGNTGRYARLMIQNWGTAAVGCSFVNQDSTSVAFPGDSNFILSGGTAANDGKGAIVKIDGLNFDLMGLKCNAAAGSSTVSWTLY